MGALLKIRKAGFEISLSGDGLAVIPASFLDDSRRAFLKRHKAEIIQALQREQAANQGRDPWDDRRYCHECSNLKNGRCVASPTRYHPVDTIPRRCPDFKEGS